MIEGAHVSPWGNNEQQGVAAAALRTQQAPLQLVRSDDPKSYTVSKRTCGAQEAQTCHLRFTIEA
jgi:hypothetical protein